MLTTLKSNAKNIEQTLIYKFTNNNCDNFSKDQYKTILNNIDYIMNELDFNSEYNYDDDGNEIHPVLSKIPHEYLDDEMCESFVKQSYDNLQYIPEEFITENLLKAYIKTHSIHNNIIHYIPNKFITKEIITTVLKNNGCNFMYIPNKFKTEDICKIAVKQNGTALSFIPKHLRTETVCEIAVNNNCSAILYVPKKLRTKKMFLLALQNKNNFDIMNFIPKELQIDSEIIHFYITKIIKTTKLDKKSKQNYLDKLNELKPN